MSELQQLQTIFYDIDNRIISYEETNIKSCNFFIRCYVNFDIEIISGNGLIYRAKSPTDIVKSSKFIGINSYSNYTIFLSDNNPVVIKCNNMSFVFQREVIDIEHEEYLSGLITNFNLPTQSELEPAILNLNENNSGTLIRHLLLDFRNIVNKRGTKQSIEKFLNFVGLDNEQLKVCVEFSHTNLDGTKNITLNPDTKVDEKTGNYHILFDNYVQNGYDRNNMPICNITIHDLKTFFEKLQYSIVLANKYFTSKEQDITFFGLNYSSNLPSFFGITSNMSCIIKSDSHFFEKSIDIDLINYSSKNNFKYLIRNNVQKITDIYKSEVKVYREKIISTTNKELFFIEREVFDDDTDFDLLRTQSLFGTIAHLNIKSPNTFIEISIVNNNNVFSTLNYPKTLVLDTLNLKFVSILDGTYTIIIDIFDTHNNRERYKYQYIVKANISNIDFITFNSSTILTDKINTITSDVDSPSNTIEVTNNIILDVNYIPENLSEYYLLNNTDNMRYLTNNEQYVIPRINKNIIVNNLTETIPLKYVEQYLNILSFPYDNMKTLKLRIINPYNNEIVIIPIETIQRFYPNLDRLFVTILDITTDGKLEPHYLITTTETGLDILDIYDLVLVDTQTSTLQPIKNLDTIVSTEIPVNSDFPLFHRPSTLVPEFVTINANKIVKSIFNRLINIELSIGQTYYLKLGDIVGCIINDKLVVSNTNMVWRVFNSFTKELLFSTTDYMLKYRIDDNICYDIECEFLINGITHSIKKQSLFSSFDIVI